MPHNICASAIKPAKRVKAEDSSGASTPSDQPILVGEDQIINVEKFPDGIFDVLSHELHRLSNEYEPPITERINISPVLAPPSKMPSFSPPKSHQSLGAYIISWLKSASDDFQSLAAVLEDAISIVPFNLMVDPLESMSKKLQDSHGQMTAAEVEAFTAYLKGCYNTTLLSSTCYVDINS